MASLGQTGAGSSPQSVGFFFFFLFVPSACSLCIVMSLTYQHEGPGKPLLMRDSQVAYYFKNNTASCFSLVPSLRPDAFNKFNMSFPVMGCGKVSETLSSHCNLPTPTSGFTLPMSSSAGPGKLRPGWTKSPPSSSARHKRRHAYYCPTEGAVIPTPETLDSPCGSHTETRLCFF